jgi:hypothetical protein
LDNSGHEITISPNEEDKPLGNRESEIYSSINDIEAYSKFEHDSKQLIKEKSEESDGLYSTPSNSRVLKPANIETPIQNYSHMQLLDEEEDSEEEIKV